MFNSFSVNITDMVGKSGRAAEVRLFDSYGKLLEVRLLNCPSREEIFLIIKEGKSLNLSNCYIKDFSLAEYRKSAGLAGSDYVVIRNLQAKDSFFDNSGVIDFSYSELTGTELNFSGSVFAGRTLSFFHSRANTEQIDFSRTSYACSDVNFQYAQLESSVLTFRSAIFNHRGLIPRCLQRIRVCNPWRYPVACCGEFHYQPAFIC